MVVPPQAARQRFGDEIRRFREVAGMSQKQLARAVAMSQSTVSGLERGEKTTSRENVARFDEVLTASGALQRRWETMNSYSGLPDWFRDVAAIEREAVEIRIHAPLLIPGLLQTSEYARSIIRVGQKKFSEAEVSEQVDARMERQKTLSGERPPHLTVIFDESPLRRMIGGREVMRQQLEHLLEMAAQPRVTLQVIEMDAPGHPGLDGAFHIFVVPETGHVVFTETRLSGSPTDAPEVVEEYTDVFTDLRGAALTERASRDLMDRIRGELQ